ncbi:hypothetical protein SO802_006798 [Lithocarpus litseifolius]|uniref:ATP-dependent Clp protease proteolytic subunit n=1 Tax=Lithocarpus litseifolius TaxID=425828 RepID=A0AAW2DQW8_9ROSI
MGVLRSAGSLETNHDVSIEVGMGLPTFSPQVLRPSVEAQNHRTYAEVVQASYGMARKLPMQLVSTAKEKMMVKQGLTGTKVGGLLVGKPAKLVVGGGDRRQMCINEKSEVGEQNQVGIRFPCLNSKAHWKERGVRRPCWTGSGLVVEVDGIGRRRVFWGRKKGGNQNLRWVSRTEKDQCKGVLGLGPNNLATHLPNNESVSWSGPVGTSPSAFEHGECSVTADEAFFSVGLLDEVGESPEESSPSPVSSSPRPELPAQRWRDGPGCSELSNIFSKKESIEKTKTCRMLEGLSEENEMLHHKANLNGYLAYHTGQNLDRTNQDTDRDFFMSAKEAKEFGLIDGIIMNPLKALQPLAAMAEAD